MAAAPTAMATATKHATTNACMVFLLFPSYLAPSNNIWQTMSLPQIRYSSREGKGLRFNVNENSPQRAHASVKISRSGAFQIDKKAPDPGAEMAFEEPTIGAGRTRNLAADKTCHDLAEDRDVILRF